eukprot:TRINITY_DN23438_c0_g1_i1.p2 TRINITY_DN23438_c0_g1~~TRINITY_DN23438_c0_g1_i1.p2  ORF type:complete len:168 (+),score=36.26 TRINITY_DN23438_c0_g1_i1:230-733(+)
MGCNSSKQRDIDRGRTRVPPPAAPVEHHEDAPPPPPAEPELIVPPPPPEPPEPVGMVTEEAHREAESFRRLVALTSAHFVAVGATIEGSSPPVVAATHQFSAAVRGPAVHSNFGLLGLPPFASDVGAGDLVAVTRDEDVLAVGHDTARVVRGYAVEAPTLVAPIVFG